MNFNKENWDPESIIGLTVDLNGEIDNSYNKLDLYVDVNKSLGMRIDFKKFFTISGNISRLFMKFKFF